MTAGENHGLAWVIGSFLLCPCHLPLTLGLAATLLTGTTLGAALRHHPVAAGMVVTVVWIAGTARGFWLMKVRARLRVGAGSEESPRSHSHSHSHSH